MLVSPLGSEMFVKREQPIKSPTPMLVTPAGIVILVNAVLTKLKPSKVVRPLGRVTLARLVQS